MGSAFCEKANPAVGAGGYRSTYELASAIRGAIRGVADGTRDSTDQETRRHRTQSRKRLRPRARSDILIYRMPGRARRAEPRIPGSSPTSSRWRGSWSGCSLATPSGLRGANTTGPLQIRLEQWRAQESCNSLHPVVSRPLSTRSSPFADVRQGPRRISHPHLSSADVRQRSP
jgi:hypothetical protein